MIKYPFSVEDECDIPKINSIEDIKNPELFPRIVSSVEKKKSGLMKDAAYSWWYDNVEKTRNDLLKKIKRKKISKMRKFLSQKKSICKKNNIPYDLDIEWYIEQLKEGCALTKIPFVISKLDDIKKKGVYSPYQPSIDRIDPNEGYLKSNCRLILHALNLFKLNFSDDHMYKIAEQLLEHRLFPD